MLPARVGDRCAGFDVTIPVPVKLRQHLSRERIPKRQSSQPIYDKGPRLSWQRSEDVNEAAADFGVVTESFSHCGQSAVAPVEFRHG